MMNVNVLSVTMVSHPKLMYIMPIMIHYALYSQLSPCRHPPITNIHYCRQNSDRRQKRFDWKCMTPAITALTITDAKRRPDSVPYNESLLYCTFACIFVYVAQFHILTGNAVFFILIDDSYHPSWDGCKVRLCIKISQHTWQIKTH